MSNLTFDTLAHINEIRCKEWHGPDGVNHWTVPDWAVAAAGEMGELCNAVKKLTRHDTKVKGALDDHGRGTLVEKIGLEAADTVIYLDLLMTKLGMNLGDLVRQKFNLVSEREGLPQRLD